MVSPSTVISISFASSSTGTSSRSDSAPASVVKCTGVAGLGILKGKIVRIPEGPGLKIPHMGWNSLNVREGASLFKGLEKEPYVYFVHSYYLQAKDPKIVAATTEYGVTIHASVEKENVFACQFHPEKSSKTGLAILKNFLAQRREG